MIVANGHLPGPRAVCSTPFGENAIKWFTPSSATTRDTVNIVGEEPTSKVGIIMIAIS